LNKLFRIGIVLFIASMFMVSSPASAFAEQAIAEVTCGKDDGTEQTFSIGWNNSNSFFDGKGDIARLFCEGGFAQSYNLYVRDNLPLDSPLRWYNGVVPILEPVPSPSPEPVVSVEPTLDPEPTPIPEPTQSESLSPEPVVTPSVTPEPTVEPSPTTIILPEVPQTLEPTPSPSQLDVVPEPEVPVPSESPSESVIEPPTPTVEPTVEPEPEVTNEPVQEVVQDEPTLEEVTQEVIDDAMSDGVLTDTERELVADALVEEFLGEAITFEALVESGLDYEDLPPEQPVMLENGVILTAEVADAIEIFDDTTELLNVLFTDPGKALKAISNIGADMTPESRETSQGVVVSAIIVGQLAHIRRVK
jgi:hypothetical protein